MGKRAGNDNADRVQLGPFWLWHRAERDEWCICWYDEGDPRIGEDGKPLRKPRTCRKTTGVSGSTGNGKPPQAAEDALADHYAIWRKPVEQTSDEALVEGLIADWLAHVETVDHDPQRARDAAAPVLRFFEAERRAGRITKGPYVSDINRALAQRYIDWRKSQPSKSRPGHGISGATISRELSALRASLRYAHQGEVIQSAPFVPDVSEKDQAGPKELIYEPHEVARILEAAWELPERRHVHLFAMIMLSTHGRCEAILELDEAEDQLRDGLIYFNAPGRVQTRKRRSIVPIAPTLAPWLEGVTGKVIMYRTMNRAGEIVTKPTMSIRTAFDACLVDAGLCEQAVDQYGKALWLEPRQKLGETARRPKLVGIGSPNTLRHTIATELHAMGVPESQIETAAGHRGESTNKKNYRHLRPGYLKEFIDGVEAYWSKLDQFTKVHRKHGGAANVVTLRRG